MQKEKVVKTKKTLVGIVTKLIDATTAKVEVERKSAHPLYTKILKKHKRYRIAFANKELKVGDKVIIEETAPVSKLKKFKLIEIVK